MTEAFLNFLEETLEELNDETEFLNNEADDDEARGGRENIREYKNQIEQEILKHYGTDFPEDFRNIHVDMPDDLRNEIMSNIYGENWRYEE